MLETVGRNSTSEKITHQTVFVAFMCMNCFYAEVGTLSSPCLYDVAVLGKGLSPECWSVGRRLRPGRDHARLVAQRGQVQAV